MVERDTQGRRRGKRVDQVVVGFLDVGPQQVRDWFKEDLISSAVLRGAVKHVGNPTKKAELQALYKELTGTRRGSDLAGVRTVIADRRGAKGPSVISFAVDTSGERGVYDVKAVEGGFFVSKNAAASVPARKVKEKKDAAPAAEVVSTPTGDVVSDPSAPAQTDAPATTTTSEPATEVVPEPTTPAVEQAAAQ